MRTAPKHRRSIFLTRRNIVWLGGEQFLKCSRRFGEVDPKSGSDSYLAGELAGLIAVRSIAAQKLALGGVLADTARHVEIASKQKK